MSTYFASNKVDDSIFPRVIRNCVGKMGLKIYPQKREVLTVCDFKAVLPEGFKKLILAILCSNKEVYLPNILKSSIDQKVLVEVPLCDDYCIHTDDCGNMTRLVQKFEFDRFSYDKFELLKPSKSTYPLCTSTCFNLTSKSKGEFEIKDTPQGKVLQTNVCDGEIYIEYVGELEMEDGFMVPDNEYIKDWIFEELRREAYTYMWDNGEDVMQRMQHSERELNTKQANARQIYTRIEVSEYYKMANKLASRFGAHERWLSNERWYRTT